MKLPPPIAGDAEFFRIFARFEYALKARAYFEYNKKNKRFHIKIDLFCNQFKRQIEPIIELREMHDDIKYLISDPPKVQICHEDGRLDFDPSPPQITNPQSLVEAIYRVRNNLFHGGKIQGRPIIGEIAERDQRLVNGARLSLLEIIERCGKLKTTFESDV